MTITCAAKGYIPTDRQVKPSVQDSRRFPVSRLTINVFLFCGWVFSCTLNAAELKQLPLHSSGRTLAIVQANGDTAYRYAWPSVYFETAFEGNQLELKFDDDKSNYRLIVDNQAPLLIEKPGLRTYPVAGLKPGKHRVRLEKISETQDQTGQFSGFYAPLDAKPIALKPRPTQIEFIGDSYTVGYGNRSASRECNPLELFNNTDTQLAFGPQVAKHFNADYQINAYSGQGVVRNYNGVLPETNLIKRYTFTLHDYDAKYTDKTWQPQVIVVGLGTNDFSTPLQPNERWQTRATLQSDFIASYVAFVKSLHANNPRAHLILMTSDQMQGELVRQVNQVASQLRAAGMVKLDIIEFKNLGYSGCHWHPSLKDDRTLSKLLIKHLNARKLLK